jgi:hypothetical protein
MISRIEKRLKTKFIVGLAFLPNFFYQTQNTSSEKNAFKVLELKIQKNSFMRKS